MPQMHGRLPAVAIAVLLLTAGPLFVCMPVNSDTALFDVQARQVLKDGVLYRDIVEPNLPGVVWVHLAIRSLFGWSSEAMRFADLMIFGAALLVCARLIHRNRISPGFVFAALLFYLSCNEWCHCQRDTWMLLPAVAAVSIRIRRGHTEEHDTLSHFRHLWQSLAEGVCWGIAFWLKPHIAVPALVVMTVDVLCRNDRAAAIRESQAVVVGGLLAAVPGIAWLMASGAWPHFLEMMLEWNPEYLQAGRDRQSPDRWMLMFRRFYPWWLVHVAALPLAVRMIAMAATGRLVLADRQRRSEALLAALYAGWLLQSLLLQHAMDYIHVPAIILGLLVIASAPWPAESGIRRAAAFSFLLLALLAAPIFRCERPGLWTRCWTEGSSPTVRARLAHGNFPEWQNLSRVADFLHSQRVRDGELTCLNVHSVHLFRALDRQPATRYWCVKILQELFPSRAGEIREVVQQSGTRFIVTETMESGLPAGDHLPSDYPWNLPVVFEAGTYRVHATRGGSGLASTAAARIRSESPNVAKLH